MGRCKWAQWNHSFAMHLSYLGPVSGVFTSWVSLGLTVWSGCSLIAARWQVFFSFLSFLWAHWLTWRLQLLRIVTFFVTDMAGNIHFLVVRRTSSRDLLCQERGQQAQWAQSLHNLLLLPQAISSPGWMWQLLQLFLIMPFSCCNKFLKWCCQLSIQKLNCSTGLTNQKVYHNKFL